MVPVSPNIIGITFVYKFLKHSIFIVRFLNFFSFLIIFICSFLIITEYDIQFIVRDGSVSCHELIPQYGYTALTILST
jgi:hypothetical protein